MSVAQALIGMALAVGVAVVAFDAELPAAPLPTLGVLALAILAMYATGMIVAALAPSPSAATASGFVLFLGFGGLGGMFGPTGVLPEAVAAVGSLLPFGAAVDALGAAWTGAAVPVRNLVALGVWAAFGSTVAAWTFRWTR